jgi:hypothetical protein
MGLKYIYYYFIAFAMMAGVMIAYVLKPDIDQGPNGRIFKLELKIQEFLKFGKKENG